MELNERFTKASRKPISLGALSGIEIIVDNDTGVNYMFYYNGQSSGLTVIVDRDGKPYISD
ncbi:MAG: DUF6440 family protein [Ruminococcus sp.]|nr:DUF6440 family protein [Ruminococcus sp.]